MTPTASGGAGQHAWTVLVLTVGGACGVNARYWLGIVIARWFGTRFPWATVTINVSGSFAIGLIAMILAERWPNPQLRIFAITGFLGGYTTFSSYLFESVTLWGRGDRGLAVSNLVGSMALGLGAVVLGMALGRWLTAMPDPSLAQEARVERRLDIIGEAESGGEPPHDAAT